MITIWHNPRCSKSRQTLALLEDKGVNVEVFKYLEAPLLEQDIGSVLKKLSVSARELMRTKEECYKELGLKEVEDEAQLIAAMVAHPRLIERPIVIHNDRAIIARPPERVAAFLASL